MAEIESLYEQLENLFQILYNRWFYGLKRFENQIKLYENSEYRNILKKRDIINSPIHNIIEINNDYLFLLLDSIFMQRLRGIHHQGLAYLVYPTATHSRFEHSLGVYKLTNDIIDSMINNPKCDFKNCEFTKTELLIAALLHDIGHYPFSHIGENIFNSVINKLLSIFPDIKKLLPKHEPRTANLILSKDIFLELKEFYKIDINPDKFFKKLFQIISKVEGNRVNIENIARLIQGIKINNHSFGHLINGPIDADKLDYILREAYFTGTPFGNIDIHRIIQGYLIGNVKKGKEVFENQLIFNKRMLTSILQMYVGREFNYSRISHHRTLRIAETTLKAILDITIEEFKNNIPEDKIEEYLKQILFHFKLMEDRDFLHFLEIMINLSPKARNLFNRLITRTLYKRIDYIDSIPIGNIKFRDVIGDYNQKLSLYIPARLLDIFNQKEKLSPLFLSIWEKIPSKIKEKIEKLNKIMEKSEEEVILLNAFNYPLSLNSIKEEIKKKMRNIYVFDEKTPDVAISLIDMGEKLSEFLTDIHNTNSNIIFAFENSILSKVKELGVFNDKEFIECFILLILAYNNII